MGTTLESDTFVIELEKLKLKREHDLTTDHAEACQKPEHPIPSPELPKVPLVLSKLIISTSSLAQSQGMVPPTICSSNQILGSYLFLTLYTEFMSAIANF